MNKTQPTKRSVRLYLNEIKDEHRRKEMMLLVDLATALTGLEPGMWGSAIIGFGSYTYYNSQKKELEWCPLGLSCRAQTQTIYFTRGLPEMEKTIKLNWPELGKYTFGKSCFHMRRLSDVDLEQLASMMGMAWNRAQSLPNPVYY